MTRVDGEYQANSFRIPSCQWNVVRVVTAPTTDDSIGKSSIRNAKEQATTVV
jgi:hypothetical protein